ncbi:MAG TPA: inosine/xanthosine triphosphatase [Flavisolibacter sp.]|nr:inosine/xanthosine triphosphatase [Flavisolibacter sp.]
MMKLTVVVASKNPVKIHAALSGLKQMLPENEYIIESVSVPSNVSDQPFSDEETATGALNRALNAENKLPFADFWIGIEGGISKIGDELTAFAWVVIKSKDTVGKARSGTFFLPKAVSDLVHQGMELGDADDLVFGSTNAKQESGAIGLLTGNVIDRKQLYEKAVIMALIPFKNKQLFT